MNTIKELLAKMKSSDDKEQSVKILQEINTLLLTQCALKIDDTFMLYPIEVEAYYSGYNFKDDTIHNNVLQKNRFGKLYFHRKAQDTANKILFIRSGIDICLSDNTEYTFGVLIRSARINQEKDIIGGPQLLAQRVYKHICKDEKLSNLSDDNQACLAKYEVKSDVLISIAPQHPSIIIHSSRIGLNKESLYSNLNLRSLSDLSISKQKEKDILEYMKYSKIEPTLENIKEIIGYKSNTILEKLKSNI